MQNSERFRQLVLECSFYISKAYYIIALDVFQESYGISKQVIFLILGIDLELFDINVGNIEISQHQGQNTRNMEWKYCCLQIDAYK